jgi:prevent-host-death family protein
MCHNVHMTKITIRDLHMKTGEWVRKAAEAGAVIVSDHGRPVAKLVGFTAKDQETLFGQRPLVKGFSTMRRVNHDSSRYLAQDRSRA